MEKNNYIVALDLGSSKVTVAAASKDPDGRLNIADIISRPMEGLERGEVTNIEHVTAAARDAVGELEESLGIDVSEAYVGISGENIRCGNSSYFVYITGPDGEICDDDVAKLHESMNTQPAPEGFCILDRIPQKYVIDAREVTMRPVGRFGNRLESTFSFILGSRNSVDRLSKTMGRLHIEPRKIFSNAQASAWATLTDDEKELGAAVIDIGAQCTDICIWHDNIMRYVAVLPIGSSAINNDIRSMAIRDKVIEKLKVAHGYATVSAIPDEKKDQSILIRAASKRDDKSISYAALTQIIESRLMDIVEHVVSEIRESGYAESLGAGLVLTGGGSRIAGIDKLFRDKTKYEVRIGGADASLLNDESAPLAEDLANSSIIGLLVLGARDYKLKPTTTAPRKGDGRQKAEKPQQAAEPAPEPQPTPTAAKEKSRREKRAEAKRAKEAHKISVQSDGTAGQHDKKKPGFINRISGTLKDGFKTVFDVEVIDDNDDKLD